MIAHWPFVLCAYCNRPAKKLHEPKTIGRLSFPAIPDCGTKCRGNVKSIAKRMRADD